MRLLATIKSMLVLVAIVLINSVGIAGHASAMSTTSHDMAGMSHQSGDATTCATLCRTAVLSNESTNPKQSENEDDNDQFGLPLPVLQPNWELSSSLVKQRLYANNIKPPPKVPIYIRYQVFRT